MEIRRLDTREDVEALIAHLSSEGNLTALDIETTGLDPWTDKLLTINLAARDDRAYVFDAVHAEALLGLTCPLVMHNFKFDVGFLYRKGIDLREREIWDTMLMHHLIDENAPHGLDELIQEYFNDNYKEIFWSKYKAFSEAPREEQDQYSGRDAIYTLRLYLALDAQLRGCPPYRLLPYVHRFAKALLDTELAGVCIDLDTLTARGVDAAVRLTALDKNLRTLCAHQVDRIEIAAWVKEIEKRKTPKGQAGVPRPRFSFDSTTQLQQLLYNELGLPVQRNQQAVTVDDAALERLAGRHAAVDAIRDYRGEKKISSAFLDSTLEKARAGVIYPSFNVNGTVTGRISSSQPNLQQLPRSGGIRAIYVPRREHVFISADYSGLEVVLAAHFSQDPNLLKVVLEGASLHDITATALGIPRVLAKTVNFAMQYGATAKKIRATLGCTLPEAEAAINKYWAAYPGLKALVDRCHACVDTGEGIVNPFGRVRHLRAEWPDDEYSVASTKRQAFNSLVQGTGADCTHLAFTRIAQELHDSGQGRALFPVHDEIIIEVRTEHAVYWNARLKEVMEAVASDINLTVPLKAEASGPMEAWLD
jgi:DNA polymerase-1